jgi:hypothetical protein
VARPLDTWRFNAAIAPYELPNRLEVRDMFDDVKFKAIVLPELSERERALRCASIEESPAGKETVQINEGALLVFDSALTDQSIADISNSVLFAQLAADKQFNRFISPGDWEKNFFNTLSVVGWAVNSSGSSSVTLPLPVHWAKLVVEHMSESAASLADTGVRACQALPQTSKAMTIWNEHALDGNRGLLLVGPAQLVRDSPTLSLTLTGFEFQKNIGGFLKWNLDYLVAASWTCLDLNEDVYSQVRQAIIDKLGDRPKYLLANVPIRASRTIT